MKTTDIVSDTELAGYYFQHREIFDDLTREDLNQGIATVACSKYVFNEGVRFVLDDLELVVGESLTNKGEAYLTALFNELGVNV